MNANESLMKWLNHEVAGQNRTVLWVQRQVRQNNFRFDWVLDMDISKFFDEVDHELILQAVSHVMEEQWVLMYVERWLKMPVQKKDGTIEPKEGKGTPQGGVISPILANLYFHFALDKWLSKHYPEISFVRYADDVVIHCKTLKQAEEVQEALIQRLSDVKQRVNEGKTHIAYCKDYRRKGNHETVKLYPSDQPHIASGFLNA